MALIEYTAETNDLGLHLPIVGAWIRLEGCLVSLPLVGRIAEMRVHPNADKIRVAIVEVCLPQPIEIVVGGVPLPVSGMLVPVALPGTRLPSGEKIRTREFRGVRSHGEILSSTELGWASDGPDHVFALPYADFALGQSLESKDSYDADFVALLLSGDARAEGFREMNP